MPLHIILILQFQLLTLLGTEIAEIGHDAVAIYILAMDPTKVVSNDLSIISSALCYTVLSTFAFGASPFFWLYFLFWLCVIILVFASQPEPNVNKIAAIEESRL
jgi:hypothetical protein